MWDFNQVVFQGRVTEDVELKETPNTKKPYCWFTVANNGPKKNPDGSLGEYTNFLNLTLFDEYAVRNVKKLWKGRRVLVIGKLIQNKWIDTRGGKHDELRIKVDRMIFDPMTPEEREKHGVVTTIQKTIRQFLHRKKILLRPLLQFLFRKELIMKRNRMIGLQQWLKILD